MDTTSIPKCFFLLFALILMIAVSAVYSNTLKSPFLLDDYGNIVDNHLIEIKSFSWDSLQQVLSDSHIEQRRKLSYLTFALNYLWTGYDPIGFHLVNIAIHTFCAFFIFLFTYQTLGIGWLKEKYGRFRFQSAAAAALIWALNPLQVNAVTYIVQRMTSLAVLFALMALTAWLAGRRRWMENRRFQAAGFFGSAILLWGLGLLSKEHVAILPLLMVVHEVFLLRRGILHRIPWPWVILGSVPVVFLVLCYLGTDPLHRILAGYARRDFTLTERLLTESRVLWHYLSLFFFPVSERFSLFHDYPVSRGFFSPITTGLSILAWIGVMSSAWVCRKRYPVLTWMTAWFWVSHLIESSVMPLEIIFEHRMYLPSIGLAMGTVLIGFDLLYARMARPWFSVFSLLLFLCILSIATYTRNMDFRDEVTLYAAELRKFPDSDRNRLGLALALNKAGRVGEGGKMLQEMAYEKPYDFLIQQNWYNFLLRASRDSSTSEAVYQHLVQLIHNGYYNPRHDAMALKNLAELFFEEGNYSRALPMVDRLLADYPQAAFFLLKGICHIQLDQWPSARQACHEAWKRDPRNINMVYWYGQSLIRSGDPARGCRLLTEGVAAATGDQKVFSLCQKMLDLQCREPN